jgi:hypothetical protein
VEISTFSRSALLQRGAGLWKDLKDRHCDRNQHHRMIGLSNGDVDTNYSDIEAFLVGLTPSSTATGAYTITQASVATPLVNPPAGAYATERAVFITSTTAGATIRYTTNGRDPVESDLELPPGQSVLVDRTILLKAKAWKNGLATSPLRKGEYEITGAVAAGGLSHARAQD